ncbi:hypothetical protein RISK_004038 [Rhodopirellula islandica]|uniref:Uncharacterized protein n=1 Tax=Rhodopirellula islandica TaxID=595434 RepID=A0A0J1BAV9_RHOIS|nr:hypothetical protein [Rhodopirellula islandica]KLU03631.1 hypothetical protein RISK_004038 [Rhodopirellula islandica]
MTPALNAFLERFAELGGDANGWLQTESRYPTLTLPAKHKDVGPLCIDDNGDELTLEVGTKHHTHFSGYNYDGDSDDSRLLAAAHDAARFAIDVIADRVCITTDYLDDRCIGSSHFYLDAENVTADTVRDSLIGVRSGNIRSDRFLWSSPLQVNGG